MDTQVACWPEQAMCRAVGRRDGEREQSGDLDSGGDTMEEDPAKKLAEAGK